MKKFFLLSWLLIVFFSSCKNDTKDILINSLHFDQTKIVMEKGESRTVYISYLPEDATKVDINYSTVNTDVISISGQSNKGCVVKAIGSGNAILVASANGYTAYLEIVIKSNEIITDSYIVVPFVDLQIERGQKKTVIASLYGGSEDQNSLFKWESSSDCVELDSVGSACVIRAIKTGISTITVSHPSCSITTTFAVIVPDPSTDLFYLTTKNNFIKVCSQTESAASFNVEIVGGVTSDYSNISYDVIEGENCIDVSGENGMCIINTMEIGIAKIQITHPKAKVPLYVNVNVVSDYVPCLIETDNDFIILNDNSQTFTATLPNCSEEDRNFSFTYEIEDESIISVVQQDNIFTVNPIKDGKSKIFISSKYSDVVHEVLVIVENTQLVSAERYIKVENSIIKLEQGQETSLKVELIGGNQNDINNMKWQVSDSSIIDVFSSNGTIEYNRTIDEAEVVESLCYITGLKVGVSSIEISNPKAENTSVVKVIVYPKGILEQKNYVVLEYDKVINCISESENKIEFKAIKGDTTLLDDITWSIEDTSIADVNFSSLSGVITVKKAGITYLNVASDGLESDIRIMLVCGTQDEILSFNYFYLDKSFYELSVNQTLYIELFENGVIDKSLYEVSSNDNKICDVYITENVLVIKAKQGGECSVTVSNNGSTNKQEKIFISVSDLEETLQYPYSLEINKLHSVLINEKIFVPFTIKNAPKTEFENLNVSVSDKSICDVEVVEGGCYINGKKDGVTFIEFSHPYIKEKVLLKVFCFSTIEEQNNTVLLDCEKTNVNLFVDDYILLDIICSDETKINDLIYSISDSTVISAEINGSSILVKALSNGNSYISVKYNDNYILNIYFSVRNNDQDVEQISFSLPTVIEMLKGDSRVISCGTSEYIDTNKIIWSFEGDCISIVGSGKDCYITCLDSGYATIYANYENKVCRTNVICATSIAELQETYVISIDKTVYEIENNNSLDLSLSFGTYIPADDVLSTLVWESDNKDIIDIEYNGDNASILALNEGIAKVKVYSPLFLNELTFNIVVKSSNIFDNSFYEFNVSHFYKLNKGDVQTIIYTILDKDGNEVNDFFDVEISLNSDKSISYVNQENFIRIEAIEKGETYLSLKSKKYGISTKILCTVYDESISDVDRENDLNLLFEKDHFLLSLGQHIDFSFIYENSFADKIDLISYQILDSSICKVEKISSNTFGLSALSKGNTDIIFKYNEKQWVVCITVIDDIIEQNFNMVTESIITVELGNQYTTQVICENDVYVSSYDNNLIDITSNEDNSFVINTIASGISEIVFKSGNVQRTVVCAVYEGVKPTLINVDNRYKKIEVGESFSFIPFSTTSLDNTKFTYTDLSKNDCVEFSYENGTFKIKGLNEGISSFRISYPNSNSFDLFIEVNDFINNSQVNINDLFYLNTDKEVHYVEVGQEAFLSTYITGDNFTFDDNYIWSVEDTSIASIEVNGTSCNVVGLKEGQTTISCFNPYCSNSLTFKIIVGQTYINNGVKVPYIYSTSNSISLDYGGGSKVVEISLKNIEGNLSDISIIDNKSNIIRFEKNIVDNVLFLTFYPVTCGFGQLKINYPSLDYTCINYVVNENDFGDDIFLTTMDDYSFVRPGELKNLSVELKNYEELDSSKFSWSVSDSSILSVIGNGTSVSVYGKKEGICSITVSHPLSKNSIILTVNVSSSVTNVKYIKSNVNRIETTVSGVLDNFSVSVIGSEETHKFSYKCSEPSMLSIIGNEDKCYYKGLKSGVCQVTVTCLDDDTIKPFIMNFIIEEDKSDGAFLTSSSNTNYIVPGDRKSIEIFFNNLATYDSSSLQWDIYSQELSVNSTASNVITLVAEGNKGVIIAENEGIAKVRVTYPTLKLKVDLIFYVSSVGTLSFTTDSIELTEKEMGYVAVDVPTFTDNMSGFISYSVENPSICVVSGGTSHVCCIQGLKEGTTIVKVTNAYDNTTDELVVKVLKDDTESSAKLYLSQSSFLMNPRSPTQTIIATLAGTAVEEDDSDNLTWEWESKSCDSLKIFPTKGKEVKLSLNSVNGKVKTGSGILKVYSQKFGLSKQIYVSVSELDNFFTIDKTSLVLDTNSSDEVKASILGGSAKDYDNIIWDLDGYEINADGTKREIARLMNKTGSTCQIYALSGGLCTLTAFYNGEIRKCEIQVNADKIFTVVNNALSLYPGQVYDLYYTLRPSTSFPTWYSSDDASDKKIIERTLSQSEQKITIKAVNEGNCTLTGFVNGVGTVTCSINVKYAPYLVSSENSENFSVNLNPTQKNKLELEFKCYPPIYYVKPVFPNTWDNYSSHYTYELEQNHLDVEVAGEDSGKGKLTLYFDGELPEGTIALQQYKDKDFKESTDLVLNYKVEAKYPRHNFSFAFKRNDGFFTFEGFDSDNYCNKTLSINPGQTINWGDGETHYIIITPQYKNMILPDSIISSKTFPNELNMEVNGPVKDGEKYVFSIRHKYDYGYDTNDPKIVSAEQFYNRFAVKKSYVKDSSGNYYYFTKDNIYYNNNRVLFDKGESTPGIRTDQWCTGLEIYWNYCKFTGGHNNWVGSGGKHNIFCKNTYPFLIFNFPFISSLDNTWFPIFMSTTVFTSKGSNDTNINNDYLKNLLYPSNEGLKTFGVISDYREFDPDMHNSYVPVREDKDIYIYLSSNYTSYTKDNFAYSYNDTYKNLLWQSAAWIASGNAYKLPSSSFTVVDNSGPYDVTIFGKVFKFRIHSRPCYRNYFSYNSNKVKVSSGDLIAHKNFSGKK